LTVERGKRSFTPGTFDPKLRFNPLTDRRASEPMTEALSATCATHPGAPAVSTCPRCGVFLCEACVGKEGGDCEPCAARRDVGALLRARRAFWFSVASVACTLVSFTWKELGLLYPLGTPLGLVALVFTLRERRSEQGDRETRRVLSRSLVLCLGSLLLQLPLALWLLSLLVEQVRLMALDR
jgi:hypothetical protein